MIASYWKVLRDSFLQYHLFHLRLPVTFRETHQHGSRDPEGNHLCHSEVFLLSFLIFFTHFRLLICTIEFAELKRVSLTLYLGIHPAGTSTAVEFQAFLFPSRLFLINDPPKEHTLGLLLIILKL